MNLRDLPIRLRGTVFFLSTFQVRIRFVVRPAAYSALRGCSVKDLAGAVGITMVRTELLGAEIVVGVFDNQLDTLLHEATHAAVKILTQHQLKLNSGTEEVLCLLVEDIFRQVVAAGVRER